MKTGMKFYLTAMTGGIVISLMGMTLRGWLYWAGLVGIFIYSIYMGRWAREIEVRLGERPKEEGFDD